ncbi:MAG: hypothetical protein JO242_05645, partial [Streptosporangiaceae bacterium]|nr:hypothetical protein [Streptosporangiaceae bacterium]
AGLAVAYVIMFCVLAGIIVVLVLDRRRLVRLITGRLPAYEPTGLVTAEDIAMLSSLRARRLARNWARATGGLPAAAAMGDYQLAATELALLHDKAGRGMITPGRFRERQSDLLGLMNVARAEFLRRRPRPPLAPWAPASGFAHTQVFPAALPPAPGPLR